MKSSDFQRNGVLALLLSSILLIDLGCQQRRQPLEGGGAEKTLKDVRVERPNRDPAPEALNAVSAFRESHPSTSIDWDRKSGFVRNATNFLAARSETEGVVLKARKFLDQNAAMFGLASEGSGVVLLGVTATTNSKGNPAGHLVRFTQQAAGLPVFRAQVAVRLNADGRPYAVRSSLHPMKSVEGELTLASDAAIDAARKYLGSRIRDDRPSARSIVFPVGDVGTRAWEVNVGPWVVVVDGADADVLLARDQTRYDSDAFVYLENPVKTPKPQVRPIIHHDASGRLCGNQICVENRSGQVANGGDDFEWRALPGDATFEDQNVYHHFEVAMDFFRDLDVGVPDPNSVKEVVPVYTLESTRTCNASYTPWPASPSEKFSFYVAKLAGCDDGSSCGSTAQYADVVYHEYTHRVLFQEMFLEGIEDEAGALHEGTSDYFSAAMLDDPCLGEGFAPDLDCLRNASDFKKYPDDMELEDHRGGQVWASALWDLRYGLGSDVANRVIRQGMIGPSIDVTFSEYAGSIAVEGAAYYLDQIGENWFQDMLLVTLAAGILEKSKEVFCAHGIAVPYGSYKNAYIETPPAGERRTFKINVPEGKVIDESRGCYGGYDIIGDGVDGWQDLKFFNENKSELEEYNIEKTPSRLSIAMTAPGGCDQIKQVTLRYLVYYKPAP